MKKYLLVFFCLMLACGAAFAQGKDKKIKTKKLSKEEAANMTQEQRLAHENARITKDGKKKMSAKQKAKVQRKQARAAKSTKAPKNGPRPKPKD
ncbi:MAG TPA: hypothetical protein DGG95_10020 [Cytophagales bacterium]|jgi:hypothetical protein|nr:hypothetical protein [Cytophagales bacterium]